MLGRAEEGAGEKAEGAEQPHDKPPGVRVRKNESRIFRSMLSGLSQPGTPVPPDFNLPVYELAYLYIAL